MAFLPQWIIKKIVSRCLWLILVLAGAIALGQFTTLPSAAAIPTTSPAPSSFDLGVQQFQAHHYEEALQAFTQAIEQQTQVSAAYSNRCLLHVLLRQYHEAIADCTDGLMMDGTNVETYLNRGLAYYRSGQYAEAIADTTAALTLQPDDYRAYYNRGLAQFSLHIYNDAIADYNQAIALAIAPQQNLASLEIANLYDDRGIAQFMLSHRQEAIADFTQALQYAPNDERAYFNRACVCHEQGNEHLALADFTQVLMINANHAQAHLNRGILHYQSGNIAAAIADLQQAAHCFKQDGNLHGYQQTMELLQEWQPAPATAIA